MSGCGLRISCDHLQSGLALSVRNLGTMGVILYATTLVSRMGAATLAAHEIMRQVFIFSIQLFSALDVTAQSLVGLHLGKVRAHDNSLHDIWEIMSKPACRFSMAAYLCRCTLVSHAVNLAFGAR